MDIMFLQKMGRKNQKANEVELIVTSIPANTLSNAVYNGYTEVLLMDSWSRYWCVIHSGCLYLYQSQDSHATTHIITLKGKQGIIAYWHSLFLGVSPLTSCTHYCIMQMVNI